MHSFTAFALRTSAIAAITLSCAMASAQPADPATTPLLMSYNPGNTDLTKTLPLGVRVSPDGQAMLVTTRPTGAYQGGLLQFGTYPWWVSVADCTAGKKVCNARTGDFYRGTGPLVAPDGMFYTVATLMAGTTNVYELKDVDMTGILRGGQGSFVGTMRGTITTDGRRGKILPTNIIDFDIVAEGATTP